MSKNWETSFTHWAKGPASTETERCENAIRAIRNAISQCKALEKRDTEVFLQGSYKNRVNIRQDSDVDVGIICRDTFYYDLPTSIPNENAIDSIGELFAFSQPGSDAEKALVAGYWLQFELGNDSFASQDVNRELKHLGYGVGNIARAFETLKKTRPQQVIQLRKSGTSKQARKTFKLTEVGKKVVDAMVKNRGVE